MDQRERLRCISRGVVVVAMSALGLTACSGGSSGGAVRTVQVDHQHDQFAGTFRGFYPRIVTVRPGDTVRFHQTWTGEPHTVTTGTFVQELAKPVLPYLDRHAAGEPLPQEIPPELMPFFEKLPSFFGEGPDYVNQNAAQPCYLDTGTYPEDMKTPCPKRVQPAFNGRQTIYNSGFIPYLGARGNTFEMKMAADTAPGRYYYYCNLHSASMSGYIDVVAKGKAIPSQGALDRQGHKEIDVAAKSALAEYEKERAGKGEFTGNLAGSGSTDTENNSDVSVDEFTPRTIKAKVGEKVTWTFVGGHTISFNVPKYFPLATIKPNGTVEFNPAADQPVKWPGPPDRPHGDGGPGGPSGPPPPAANIDAGSWDGSGGLHSTGSNWNTGDKFNITFTKAGTYLYACIIHPAMIAKVVVS